MAMYSPGESRYKRYLLIVLLTILAFNYVDRSALGLVLQSLKTDLSLSDTQLGFLSGIAFALFYSVLGIPLGRWADRGDRVRIISVTSALWSVAVMLCGSVTSFSQLLLVRIGVAVGEAGCIPPAHSLIADYFSRAERPRAVAIYMLGGSMSMVIGYFGAGWLNELYGWRVMFTLLGLPGLGLAVLAWLTLRELRRDTSTLPLVGRASADAPAFAQESIAPARPDLRDVGRTLWTNSTFRHLLFCFSVTFFFGYGVLQWQPAFFMRTYGMSSGELGTWFAAVYGLGGLLGTYYGGELASRYAANNERLQLRAMAIAYCCCSILSACIYLLPNRYLALSSMMLATMTGAVANGPLFATLQTLVPERMRAVSIAIIYLFANLIGMGLGPLAAGALSDMLQPWAGSDSLRYALLALSPGYCWGAWHLWCASRTVAVDLATTQSYPRGAAGRDTIPDTPSGVAVD